MQKLKYSEYVGIMRNTGWFNMCKVDLLYKIEKIIDTKPKDTYLNSVKIERALYSSFKNDNILSIKNHFNPHSCFQAIFVKENRIGINNGSSTKKARLSYITPIHLQICIALQNMKFFVIFIVYLIAVIVLLLSFYSSYHIIHWF